MRHIAKPQGTEAEACIQGFINAQMNGRAEGTSWEELRVDYGGFTRTPQLRSLLIKEQHGLCAYTGVGIDSRLAERRPSRLDPPRKDYWFKPHIEHLKSEEQCRSELEESGSVVGREVGEDMAYANMVAAIEVAGTPSEHFGAAYRGTRPLPILPTSPSCQDAFLYLEQGTIKGLSADADLTISNLRLDHPTLVSWRKGAVRAYSQKLSEMSGDELRSAIAALEDNGADQLDEFAFVLAQIARSHLARMEQPPA